LTETAPKIERDEPAGPGNVIENIIDPGQEVGVYVGDFVEWLRAIAVVPGPTLLDQDHQRCPRTC